MTKAELIYRMKDFSDDTEIIIVTNPENFEYSESCFMDNQFVYVKEDKELYDTLDSPDDKTRIAEWNSFLSNTPKAIVLFPL